MGAISRKNKLLFFTTLLLLLITTAFAQERPGAERREEFPIAGEFQGWADFNNNGVLDRGELDDLLRSVREMLSEPHEVQNPIDEFFDFNGDGGIDPGEVEIARNVYFRNQVRRIFEFNPETARLVDDNQNRRIEEEEIEMLMDYLIFDPGFRDPHPIRHPIDEKINANNNERIEQNEIENAAFRLYAAVSLMPADEMLHRIRMEIAGGPEADRELRPVETSLDELADLDHNGQISLHEQQLLEEGMRGPHRVENEIDKRLDQNDNGTVEEFEIVRANRAAEIMLERPDFFGEGFPIITLVDKQFDQDSNGMITPDEIERVVRYFLIGPHDARMGNRYDQLFDLNGDRFVDEEELIRSMDRFFRPHPVDPDIEWDRELDTNNDQFIAPEEIGIAAGFSPEREIPPLDALIEEARWAMERDGFEREENREHAMDSEIDPDAQAREDDARREAETEADSQQETSRDDQDTAVVDAGRESRTDSAEDTVRVQEMQKKLDLVADKKLAVVSLSASTENVDEESTKGILVFIENAFVNIGKVKVVDRQNIENIISEHKFQLSGVVDEETAVEIGKLSGADIIVTGSINYVGKKYYLNIKLIQVDTAEIIGSSISETADDSDFYNLTNDAVYKLF